MTVREPAGAPAPGLLISAPRSGSGKTLLTVGLARLLARQGTRVRCAKSGPDYIDGALAAAASGRPHLNLDSRAMSLATLDTLARDAGRGVDLVLAEGAMGLFDGAPGPADRTGAAADLAVRYGWPVILVLDVAGQGRTAAAVALGLARFDPRVRIAGAVLNRVANERHRALVEDGFRDLDIPVLGALPRDEALRWPERHLGLVQAADLPDLEARLDRAADAVRSGVDVERLLSLAGRTERPGIADAPRPALAPPGGRIALARDEAFTFVYPHVLDGWRQAGATVLPFSPLADEPPPADADSCWLPGGYPELHAGRLSAADRFRTGLRAFAETRPVHGECGGYMVLGEALETQDGTVHPMAGCLPVITSFRQRRLHLGYRFARLRTDCALGRAGTLLSGHEFHYGSVCEAESAPADLAAITDARGDDLGLAGHRYGLVSGTFFHAIEGDRAGVGI